MLTCASSDNGALDAEKWVDFIKFSAVGQHAMIDKTELLEEQWEGTEQEERDCYVSEVRKAFRKSEMLKGYSSTTFTQR